MEIKNVIELLTAFQNIQPLNATSPTEQQKKRMIGEYVIVRCRDAGVHSGYLEDYNGREVVLTRSRRLWYWKCIKEHSLSSISKYGAHDDSKFAAELKEIILGDACEIIPCTEESRLSIQGKKSHDPS